MEKEEKTKKKRKEYKCLHKKKQSYLMKVCVFISPMGSAYKKTPLKKDPNLEAQRKRIVVTVLRMETYTF